MHPFRYALTRRFVMAPENGAGAGGGAAPAAGAGDQAAPPAADGAAAAAAAAAAAGGGGDPPGSIFDAAAAGGEPAKGADGKPVKPDWVADQFWNGEKGEVDVQALAKSQRDLRAQVSRGEGKLPEKPEGYTIPTIEGVPPDLVKPDDPLLVETRAAAHAAGITDSQMQAVMKPYLTALAKAKGAAADPEAARAAYQAEYQAELAKLGPNARTFVADVGGRINGMVSTGALNAAEAAALKAVGTADGVRALAKLLEAQGAPSIPTDAMQADSMTQADAVKMLREGHATGDKPKIEKATAALAALERRGALKPAA
jgi:hypothetical protein